MIKKRKDKLQKIKRGTELKRKCEIKDNMYEEKRTKYDIRREEGGGEDMKERHKRGQKNMGQMFPHTVFLYRLS
jgi:hypothetical protein